MTEELRPKWRANQINFLRYTLVMFYRLIRGERLAIALDQPGLTRYSGEEVKEFMIELLAHDSRLASNGAFSQDYLDFISLVFIFGLHSILDPKLSQDAGRIILSGCSSRVLPLDSKDLRECRTLLEGIKSMRTDNDRIEVVGRLMSLIKSEFFREKRGARASDMQPFPEIDLANAAAIKAWTLPSEAKLFGIGLNFLSDISRGSGIDVGEISVLLSEYEGAKSKSKTDSLEDDYVLGTALISGILQYEFEDNFGYRFLMGDRVSERDSSSEIEYARHAMELALVTLKKIPLFDASLEHVRKLVCKELTGVLDSVSSGMFLRVNFLKAHTVTTNLAISVIRALEELFNAGHWSQMLASD